MKDTKRKLHRSPPNHIRIAESLQAQKLWKMGHRGMFTSCFLIVPVQIQCLRHEKQVLVFMWQYSIRAYKMDIHIFLT